MGYPRSFLGLLLAGFTLVALPLVGALAYSAWNTERLTEQSRNAVYSASQAARASRSLVNRIGSIERLAQQMAVVNDTELAADFVRVHRSFKQVADELMLLPLEEKQLVALKKTVEQEQGLYDSLNLQPWRKGDARRVGRLTVELAENAQEVLAISYLVADREVLSLRHNAETVQRQLILLVIFSTAVVLTISLALTRYISRPIAELDAAIRQLGGADFARRITVRGPEDLQSLGERLDWLRRRLAELEAEKNRFLRHLSHVRHSACAQMADGGLVVRLRQRFGNGRERLPQGRVQMDGSRLLQRACDGGAQVRQRQRIGHAEVGEPGVGAKEALLIELLRRAPAMQLRRPVRGDGHDRYAGRLRLQQRRIEV